MKFKIISFNVMMVILLSCVFVQGSSAATVQGHVEKLGQTDHSGIMVAFETPASLETPSIGITGIIILLLSLSLFFLFGKRKLVKRCSLMCALFGLVFVAHAEILHYIFTDNYGDWQIEIPNGTYDVCLTFPGYDTVCIPNLIVDHDITIDTVYILVLGPTGSLYSTDPIVGNMRSVQAGRFIQGSPETEPCRWWSGDETQFIHTLTRNLAVMETEITRQMWTDLRAVQPTLPIDPSDEYSPTMNHPVSPCGWYDAILFANLLSLQNGYTRCYYTDSAFTNPITSSNFQTGPFYCNFTANGYRLPSEGEWEYFTRAGTTTAFSCNETNYNDEFTCNDCAPGQHPTLENFCVFCANDSGMSAGVGSKLPNPWGLKDVHGNVW